MIEQLTEHLSKEIKKINAIKQKVSGQQSLTFQGANGKANNTITICLVKKNHDFEFPTSFDSWRRIVEEQLLG